MPTSETIAQQPALLRVSQVYNPYLDKSHVELVVVIGNNDVHRLPLSLSEHGQLDAFPGLFIIARRREKRVVIYSREVVTLGNSEVVQVHILESWVSVGRPVPGHEGNPSRAGQDVTHRPIKTRC
jgi:hypothetical protein